MKQNKHLIKLDGESWLSPTRYGEFFGKSRQGVYQLIQSGGLRQKKHAGRLYVAGLPPAAWVPKPELLDEWNQISETWLAAPAPNEKKKTETRSRRPPDLNFEKARKMAAEAELAELKLEEKKGEMSRATAEMVIEIFRDSFASVIEHLYELDLNKAQLAKLRTLYRAALDDMKRRVEALGATKSGPEEETDG